MNEEEAVLEPQVETEAETVNQEVEFDATALLSQLEKEKELRKSAAERAKAAEYENKKLKQQLSTPGTAPLAVEDYIDISASLDGLDAREKSFLAEQHKLSGKPLKDIRSGEDFQLWQTAYRQKLSRKGRSLFPINSEAQHWQKRKRY
jgi:hypothetical protein